ncbi:MAG TPA: hypothetical protein VIU11_23860 [Nakamurella sp.]
MLDIDLSFPRRTLDEFVDLVRAVDAAAVDDEVEAVEWKDTLDLTKLEHVVKISRWIIGVANRSPRAAADQCGGLAFLLIGAGPTVTAGMRSWDDSQIRPKIDQYVRGPRWTAHNISVGDRNVLMFVVEPPADGDRIHCLQKEFTFIAPNGDRRVHRAGEIVVRVGTSTRPAAPADLAMLQDRLLAGDRPAADLALQFTHLHVQHVDASPDEIDRWVEAQALLIAPARRPLPEPLYSVLTDFGENAGEYNARVDEFLTESRRRIRGAALEWMTIRGVGAVQITVANTSDHTAKGVRLALLCPPQLEVFDPTFEPVMPPVPEPQAKDQLVRAPSFHLSHLAHQARPLAPDRGLSIIRSSSSVEIIRRIGKLHPHQHVEVELPPLIYGQPSGHTSFNIDWSVSATNRKGRVTGRVTAPVTGRPMSLRDLLPPRRQQRS